MNELGMVYATSDQVIEYDSPSGDYVKQYEGIPEDGVLAQSDTECEIGDRMARRPRKNQISEKNLHKLMQKKLVCTLRGRLYWLLLYW